MTPPCSPRLVSFHKFAEWARFEHIHLVDSSFSIWDLHPDILTRPYTSRSSRIIDPSGAPVEPSGGDSAYNSSRRALGVSLQEGFLAVNQRSFRSSRCENLHHAVNGRDFRGRTTALNVVNVRILETTCAPSGLGDMSTVCFFPAKHQSRRDNTLLFSLPDRGGLFTWCDRHGLEPQHAFPFTFGSAPDCFFVVFFSSLPMHFICVAPREFKNPPWANLASASWFALPPAVLQNPV